MAKIKQVKLGSIHEGDTILAVGSKYTMPFSIGASNPQKLITWNRANKLLIAAEPVLVNISYKQIDEVGYISGKVINIDGRYYFCRSLKLGKTDDADSEWKKALRATNTSDKTWNWSKNYFWGQEESDLYPGERVFCGYLGHDFWGVTTPEKFVGLGFRPVLEELPDSVQISDDLIGVSINVYGTNGHVVGTLLDYTEYDMILRTNIADVHFPKYGAWIQQVADGEIIVDRQSVNYIQIA